MLSTRGTEKVGLQQTHFSFLGHEGAWVIISGARVGESGAIDGIRRTCDRMFISSVDFQLQDSITIAHGRTDSPSAL